MTRRVSLWAAVWVVTTTSFATAQTQATANPNQVAAKVERAPLHLTPADRYQVPNLLEPLRKVVVMAPADGVLKSLAVPVGAAVKEGQEIGRLETAPAMARLKIAMADVKAMEAGVGDIKEKNSSTYLVVEAHLDAARARAELAQMEVDACTLRAPFAGKIMAVSVSPGQYLSKGSTILELADVSSVRVLLPVDRTAVALNGTVNFTIEGNGVNGKAQALLPLPERDATLRELASPLAAAWVVVANPSGAYEPGQRAHSPFLPNAPIAGVPSYSTLKDEAGNPTVQVIRGERVTDVPIRVIGTLGPDRLQVSGPFRASDVLIQSTSVPLRAGTFIRFSDAAPARTVEGVPPPAEHVGEAAEVAPAGVAPIGSGRTAGRPATRPAAPAAPAATKPATGGVTPF
ncbi:MAG TPA: HlyD family efflux transporter periplasmic adaptor subunit [Isosphaeraceae bacterium]